MLIFIYTNLLIVLPWLMSGLTIYSTYLAGLKSKHAWSTGLLNQALWLIYIFTKGEWGLLPMNIALWIVFYRNWKLWK